MAPRIVGLSLLQNEEHFATWAIGNALDFCDEMIVIDNRSTDATLARLEALAKLHPKIRIHRDSRALHTNSYVQPYIGKDVWVFGVDGDEIFDRDGLARLRARLLGGAFADVWSVSGHSVHATTLDLDHDAALGYVTPAAAPATKLYNFSVITSWHADTQRLHGTPTLRDGLDIKAMARLSRTETWEACDFRCLHMCFFPRSSVDVETEVRKNITDKSLRNVWRRPVFSALRAIGLDRGPVGAYLAPRSRIKKQIRYMVGDVAPRGLSGFGRPIEYLETDPAAADTERLIATLSAQRAARPDLRDDVGVS